MKTAFSKVITIWLTIVLLVGAVVGINVFADANTVATVDFKNVSYDGQIQLVYYVKTDVADAADGSYVKIRFWREGVVPANVNDQLYAAEEKESTLTRTVSGVDYSIYFSGGILPKMMSEDVYACTVRYDANDNVINTGELFKFSVQEYVKLRLAAGSTDAQVELYMALLGYGAAVQQAFEYNTNKLADKLYNFEGFTASEASGADVEKTIYCVNGIYYGDAANIPEGTDAANIITYKIIYTGASVVWDADDYAFTVSKVSEIVSITGSDGSTSLVYGDKTYTAGDIIYKRDWLTSDGTVMFRSERPGVNIYNPMTLPTDSDILFEFDTDINVNRGTNIANVTYVELYDTTASTPKATATIQRYYSDKLYFNGFASGDTVANTSSGNIIGVAATLVDGAYPTVNYRVVVAKADAENVTVTLYVNGTQAGNVLTVPAFNLDRIKFMFQDDGQDRNSVVTLTNTNFIKYVAKAEDNVNPAEPNTPGLPNVDSNATVTTSEIWGIDNGDGTMTYSTTDNGGTKYLVSYKSTPDIAINSNNTVTYTYNPVITAIKTADGADVAYLTRTESGYDKTQYGVGDTIPHRWFFTENYNGSGTKKFAASGAVVNKLSATRVDVTADQIDSDLLYVFETEMTVESYERSGDWLNAIFNISFTKSNDTRYATAALAKTRNTGRTNIYPHKLGSAGNVGGYEYSDVKLGDTFTYRLELRKTETAYKAVLIFNGVQLNEVEFDIEAAELNDVRLYIGSRDDSPYRYNSVTFKNFKWIRYNVVELAQPDDDEILTPEKLPTANKDSTTTTSTIYSTTPGVYTKTATGAEGEVAYDITYKSGIDTLVNPDGSVTFSKIATILSIKCNGEETTLSYGGKTYGASGDGVITYIPHHDFFYSTSFGSSQRLFVASTGVIATSSHVYGTYVEGLEENIITLLEFDANFEAVGNAAAVDMFQLVMGSKGGGTAGYILFSRDANGNVYVRVTDGDGVAIVSSLDTGANLGDTFKFRIEVRSTDKDAGNSNVRVYINNVKVGEGDALAKFIRGDIQFNVYDYSAHRNHVVTINNFKWLRANSNATYYN